MIKEIDFKFTSNAINYTQTYDDNLSLAAFSSFLHNNMMCISFHTCHFNVMNFIYIRNHEIRKPQFRVLHLLFMIHKRERTRVDWLNAWEIIIHERVPSRGYTHMTSRFFAVDHTHLNELKMIAGKNELQNVFNHEEIIWITSILTFPKYILTAINFLVVASEFFSSARHTRKHFWDQPHNDIKFIF